MYKWEPPKIGEKKENEVTCYTVAIGNLPMLFHSRKVKKRAMEAVKFISEIEGFVGLYPFYPRGTLCLFKTENDAKRARNIMRTKGIETGTNIGKVYVDKKYIKD